MKLENNFTIDAPVEKAWDALNNPETVAPCFPGATLTDYEGDSFTGTVKVKLGPISMTYKGKGTYVSRDEAAHEVVIDANGRDSRGNGTANATVTASLAADGPDRTTVSMVTDMTITGKPAQFGRGVISDVADKIIGQFSACVARKLAPAAESVSAASAPTSEAMTDAPAAPQASASTNGAAATTPSPAPSPSPRRTPRPTRASTTGTAVTPASAGTVAAAAPEASAPAAPAASEVEAPASTAMTPEPGVAAPSGSAASAVEAPASTAMASAPTSVTTPRPTPRAPVHSEVDAIDLLDTAGAPVLKRLAPVAGGAVLLLLVVLLVRRLRGH